MYFVESLNGSFSLNQEDVDAYREFIKVCGGNQLKGFFSNVFIVDLIIHERVHHINPCQVIQCLLDEEIGINNSNTKPASIFSRKPLKGLWHKHYFSGKFIAQNIQNEFFRNKYSRGKLSKIITKVLNENPLEDAQNISKIIAKEVVEIPYEKRKSSGGLTGEWVVFARENGKNYYLCMATHKEQDIEIYNKIKTYCQQ